MPDIQNSHTSPIWSHTSPVELDKLQEEAKNLTENEEYSFLSRSLPFDPESLERMVVSFQGKALGIGNIYKSESELPCWFRKRLPIDVFTGFYFIDQGGASSSSSSGKWDFYLVDSGIAYTIPLSLPLPEIQEIKRILSQNISDLSDANKEAIRQLVKGIDRKKLAFAVLQQAIDDLLLDYMGSDTEKTSLREALFKILSGKNNVTLCGYIQGAWSSTISRLTPDAQSYRFLRQEDISLNRTKNNVVYQMQNLFLPREQHPANKIDNDINTSVNQELYALENYLDSVAAQRSSFLAIGDKKNYIAQALEEIELRRNLIKSLLKEKIKQKVKASSDDKIERLSRWIAKYNSILRAAEEVDKIVQENREKEEELKAVNLELAILEEASSIQTLPVSPNKLEAAIMIATWADDAYQEEADNILLTSANEFIERVERAQKNIADLQAVAASHHPDGQVFAFPEDKKHYVEIFLAYVTYAMSLPHNELFIKLYSQINLEDLRLIAFPDELIKAREIQEKLTQKYLQKPPITASIRTEITLQVDQHAQSEQPSITTTFVENKVNMYDPDLFFPDRSLLEESEVREKMISIACQHGEVIDCSTANQAQEEALFITLINIMKRNNDDAVPTYINLKNAKFLNQENISYMEAQNTQRLVTITLDNCSPIQANASHSLGK